MILPWQCVPHLRVQQGSHARDVEEALPPDLPPASQTHPTNRSVREESVEEGSFQTESRFNAMSVEKFGIVRRRYLNRGGGLPSAAFCLVVNVR
jgi:hypothetical protein